MVQRLAPEKGTIRALEALATIKRTKAGLLSLDGKRPVHVMIAGDGPSRAGLTAFAKEHQIPATFVGNIPNMEVRSSAARASVPRIRPSVPRICHLALHLAERHAKPSLPPTAPPHPFSTTGPPHPLSLRHRVMPWQPSRQCSLSLTSDAASLPLSTPLSHLPTQLPPLYRAADVFVTCSTSETFGLTVLEALACGTPAVLPHCGVFDELWIGKVPDAWIYNEGVEGSILSSLRAAASPAAREYLAEHPVKASWEDATKELLGQYRELITANLPNRQVRASWLGKLDSLLRALAALMISLAVLYLSLRRSYRRAIQVWARLQGLWFVADMLSLLPDVPDVPDEPDKH